MHSINVPAGPLFGPDSRSMSSGDARTDLAVFSQQVFLQEPDLLDDHVKYLHEATLTHSA